MKEKAPDPSILEGLHYDNTPPVDSNGKEVEYDNKKHDLTSAQYLRQREARKKNSS